MRTNKLLLIMLLCTFTASAQVDTLCLPTATVRNMHGQAQQKKFADSIIVLLEQNIEAYKSIIAEERAKQDADKQTIKVHEDRIAYLEKEVKKWRRKVRWTAIAGVVAVGVTVYLLKD